MLFLARALTLLLRLGFVASLGHKPGIPVALVREAAAAAGFGSTTSLEEALQSPGSVRKVPFGNITLCFISDKHDVSVNHIIRENAGRRGHESGYGAGIKLGGSADSGGTVVDVGANLGDFSIYIAKLRPRMQILAVEPSPTTFAYLLWNLLLNGVPILRPHEFGVAGGRGGVLPLHRVASNESMTLFYKPSASFTSVAYGKTELERDGDPRDHFQWAKGWRAVEVSPLSLPDFLYAHGVQQLEWLKVDCEGCEYRLLPEMSNSGWLSTGRTRLLGGELHPHIRRGSRLADSAAIRATLARRGCSPPVMVSDRVWHDYSCDATSALPWIYNTTTDRLVEWKTRLWGTR